MKKSFVVLFILLCFIVVLGCNQSGVNEIADEKLTEPNYEIQSVFESMATEDSSVITKDGYKYIVRENRMASGEKVYTYIPYVEKKAKGVVYLDDAYDDITRYAEQNAPQGTVYLQYQATGSLFMWNSSPVVWDERESEIELNPLFGSNELFTPMQEFGYDGDSNLFKMEERKYDILCVNVALYEDYYENIPNATVKLYGVSSDLWNKHVKEGKDGYFSLEDYRTFYNVCQNAKYTNCTLVSEKDIDSTGLYYIDFNEIEKKEKYKTYCFVVEFDKSMEYSCCFTGTGVYTIQNSTEYELWKKEHSKQFVAGL